MTANYSVKRRLISFPLFSYTHLIKIKESHKSFPTQIELYDHNSAIACVRYEDMMTTKFDQYLN